MKITYKL